MGTLFAGELSGGGILNILDFGWVNFEGDPGMLLPVVGTLNYSTTDECGSLWYAGGQSLKQVGVTGPYNVDVCDRTILVDNSSTTVTLPLAIGRPGRILQIKPQVGAQNVRLLPSGLDVIEGTPGGNDGYTIYDKRDSVLLQSDGVATWNVLALTQSLSNGFVTDFTVHVSTTGSDDNDGLTLLTPVLTLSRALEIIYEHGWDTLATILFAAGTYVLPTGSIYTFRTTARGSNNEPYVLRGAKSVITSDTVVAISTEPVSSQIIISATGPFVPNAFRGRVLTFTSGVLAGTSVQIADNTATDIYIIIAGSPPPPTPGDTFDIERNDTTLVCDQIRFSLGTIIMNNLDIDLVSNVGNNTALSFFKSSILTANVRFLSTSLTIPPTLQFIDTLLFTSVVASNISPTLAILLGFTGFVADGGVPSLNIQFIRGFMFINNSLIYHTQIGFIGCQVISGSLYFDESVIQLSSNTTCQISSTVILNGPVSTDSLINVNSFSEMNMQNVLISDDFTNNTFNITNNSRLTLNTVTIDTSNVLYNANESNINFNNVTYTSAVSTNNSNLTLGFVNFNLFTYDSPGGLNFTGASMNLNNVTIRNVTFSTTWDAHACLGSLNNVMFDTVTNINFNSSKFTSNTITFKDFQNLSLNTSEVSSNTLTFDNGQNINVTTSTLNCNDWNIINYTTITAYILSLHNSNVTIRNWIQTNQNFTINMDLSRLALFFPIIDGGITQPFISAIYQSNIDINDTGSVFRNLLFSPITMATGSSLSLRGVLFDNNSAPIVANSFTKITFHDVTCTNHNVSNFLDANHGSLHSDITPITMTAGSGQIAFNLTNVHTHINDATLTNCTNGAIRVISSSDFEIINSQIIDTLGVNGMYIENTQFTINGVEINNSTNSGCVLARQAQGYIQTLTSTVPNGLFGLELLTGSSFANQQFSNIITGASGDVNVGNLGTRTWAQIDGGLLADTNDWTIDPSQYVYISPA